LINNAIFLADKINKDTNVLTLPDVLAKRYGKVVEVLVSLVSIASFMFLLAGNFVGQGFICAYTWGVPPAVGIWVAAAIVWAYTVVGGLFSVSYTDVVQGLVGWYVLFCLFVGVFDMALYYCL
jgi:Na+/proline symporter